MEIPFNRPHTTGSELAYIQQAVAAGHLSGNGEFSRHCAEWLRNATGAEAVLLTHSCTGALEMAAMLLDLRPGDEVIMPSFTFVSGANAVVLRGAVPVFVDVRDDTLNIDETKLDIAVTSRTRAVWPTHYAGVGCAMEEIEVVASAHGLAIVEDAAQGLLADYRGRALGSFGRLAAISFHETKNVHCGEGGALLVNDPKLVGRAEIVQEKGTNRRQFFRGDVDKYTWVDIGGSYPPSEINAAFLWAQLEEADRTTRRRLEIWNAYHTAFESLEGAGFVRRPIVPGDCNHNGHIYYLLMPTLDQRQELIRRLRDRGVHAIFHYVPLHQSDGGRRFGRVSGDLRITEAAGERLVRLPLWPGMTDREVATVIEAVRSAVTSGHPSKPASVRVNGGGQGARP